MTTLTNPLALINGGAASVRCDTAVGPLAQRPVFDIHTDLKPRALDRFESAPVPHHIISGGGVAANQRAQANPPVYTTPVARPMTAHATPSDHPKEIQNLLYQYGSFALDDTKSWLAQSEIERIVKALREDTDPAIKVIFVNSPEVNAFITGDKQTARLVIFKGMIDVIDDEDELAACLAHEICHTTTFEKHSVQTMEIRRQLVELTVADRLGIRRLARAGYDPRAMYRLLQKLPAPEKSKVCFMGGFLGTHPDARIRISSAGIELSSLEKTMVFPGPKPISAILKEIRGTTASTPKPLPKEPAYTHTIPKAPALQSPVTEYSVSCATIYNKVMKDPEYQALATQEKIDVLSILFRWQAAGTSYGNNTKTACCPGPLLCLLHFHFLDTNHHLFGTPFHYKDFIRLYKKSCHEGRLVGSDDSIRMFRAEFKTKFPHYLLSGERTQHKWILSDIDYTATTGYVEIERLAQSTTNEGAKIAACHAIMGLSFTSKTRDQYEYYNKLAICDSIYPTPVFDNLDYFKLYEGRILHQFDLVLTNHKRKIILKDLHAKASAPRALVEVNRYSKLCESDLVGVRVWEVLLGARIEEFYWAGFALGESDIVSGEYFERRVCSENKDVFARILRDARLTLEMRITLAINLGSEELIKLVYQEFVFSVGDLIALKKALIPLEQKFSDRGYRSPDISLFDCLEMHPEWTITLEDIETLSEVANSIDQDRFWQRSKIVGVRAFYRRGASHVYRLLKNWLDKKGAEGLASFVQRMIFSESEYGYSPNEKLEPAYSYDLEQAAARHDYLIKRLRDSQNYPKNNRDEHRLLLALSRRGATLRTDEWAARLYLDPGFAHADLLKEALEAHTVWDLEYRRQIYNKYRELSTNQTDPVTSRAALITDGLLRLTNYFSEFSATRAQVFEDFAGEIGATYDETVLIEAAKYDQDKNVEALVLRSFNGILAELDAPAGQEGSWSTNESPHRFELDPKERQIQLISFLVGKGELPKDLEPFINRTIGRDRLRRQFQSHPPYFRMRFIDTLLQTKDSLYGDLKYRQRLVDLVLDAVGENRDAAELIINSILHALRKVSPYQETQFMAFLIGQLGDRAATPGQQLRIALEALGHTGVSIGQKLYQRRLVPEKFLAELADLQDQALPPTRLETFKLMADLLGIPDLDTIDNILELKKILGSGSTKIIAEVKYLDGRVANNETRALKMLRPHFVRSTEIEIAKLDLMVDYLETHGGAAYRRLRSGLQAVKNSLWIQADALAESRVVDKVKTLYDSGAVAVESGFMFVVVGPDLDLSHGPSHVHERVAQGVSLKTLTGIDRAQAFGAIYMKEEAINFSAMAPVNAGAMSGRDQTETFFEGDRHAGNYKADLSGPVPTIYIYDYPLLRKIDTKKQKAMFEVLGLIHEIQGLQGLSLLKHLLLKETSALVVDNLITFAKQEQTRRNLKDRIEEALKLASRNKSQNVTDIFLDILALSESAGVTIDDEVFNYLTSLGFMEFYAIPDAGLPGVLGSNAFRTRVRGVVEYALADMKRKYSLRGVFDFLARNL
ncbi:MAG: M48 family metalloprotease [Deltaproteobacteria bacterium]|nr:M48 family metalloprotease [Deltaproteobacteria bacterium]